MPTNVDPKEIRKQQFIMRSTNIKRSAYNAILELTIDMIFAYGDQFTPEQINGIVKSEILNKLQSMDFARAAQEFIGDKPGIMF